MGNMMPENLCSCYAKAGDLTSSQDLSIEVMHGLGKAIFTVCATVEKARQELQDWKQDIVDQKVLVQQLTLKFWKICLLKYGNQNNALLIQDIVMTAQLATISASVIVLVISTPSWFSTSNMGMMCIAFLRCQPFL